MSDISRLVRGIDEEFARGQGRIKALQASAAVDYQAREKRLQEFAAVCERLQEVWRPRLEALAQRFGSRATVAPRIQAMRREAVFGVQSELARITLTLSAFVDRDVRNLVLDYDLEIIPMLMSFRSHDRAEFPLDAVNPEDVAAWVDERLLDFVRTYIELHENEHYVKGHMVSDPVADVRFPSFAAAATLDHQGKKLYFISDETRREFAARNGISLG